MYTDRRFISAVALFLALAPAAAAGQVMAARGDANCSGTVSAADFAAVALGAGGTSLCGNEDCDRNGVTDAADARCTAGCLFDVCSIPPGAPQVTDVTPVSAPTIAPFSVIQLTGENFGGPDRLTRATIGGIEAEVVDLSEPSPPAAGMAAQTTPAWGVVVPGDLLPGLADLVVIDGDVAGLPLPIAIGPAVPLGEPDTFDSTMDLLDTAVAKLAALDLEEAFGDNAEPLGSALQDFRNRLAELRAQFDSDPNVTPVMRAQVGAGFDASGVPEMLRDLIAEIDGTAGADSGAAASATGAAAAPTGVVGGFVRGAKTIRVVQAVGGAVATGLTLPATPVLAGIALVAGVVAGVIVAAVASPAGTPFVENIAFDTFRGPHAGSIVTVTGQRLTDKLLLQVYAGFPTPFVYGPPQTASATQLTYRLGTELCGRASFQVVDPENSFGLLYVLPSRIVPEFLGLTPSSVKAGEPIFMESRGVRGCGAKVDFFSDNNVVGDPLLSLKAVPVEGQPKLRAVVPATAWPRTYSAYLGTYASVDGPRPIEVKLAVTGLRISCEHEAIHLSPAGPSQTVCLPEILPDGAHAPKGSTFDWALSDTSVATLVRVLDTARVLPERPGTTTVSAALVVGDSRLPSQNQIKITVSDITAPEVMLSLESSAKTTPGGQIAVRAAAHDNHAVKRIVLKASGDAVEGEQSVDCPEEEDCSVPFLVTVTSAGLQAWQVTITAEAYDPSGNKGTSTTLTVPVTSDTECPEVTIQSPPSGGTVQPDATVQISALVTDNRPDDTGVRIVRANATGAAVAQAPVPAEVTLPAPLPQFTRLAPFKVKPAADIAKIADRTINILAAATDDAGNYCEKLISVTATGPPMISGVPATVDAGDPITIIGAGFGQIQGNGSVAIGGKNAAVVSWSDTQVVATVPADLNGKDIQVVVTVNGVASNTVTTKVRGPGDVHITLTWHDINDLDLYVLEPNNELIYYDNPTSNTGGRLANNENGECSNITGSPHEDIFWPEGGAPAGTYIVLVIFRASCFALPAPSEGITVTAEIDGQVITLIDNQTLDDEFFELSAEFTRPDFGN